MRPGFIQERRNFKNVAPRTLQWHLRSFKAFDGAPEPEAAIKQRIVEPRDRARISHLCQHAAMMHQRLAALALPELRANQRAAGLLLADCATAEDNALNGKRRSNATNDAGDCSGCRECWQNPLMYTRGFQTALDKRERRAEANVRNRVYVGSRGGQFCY